MNTSILMHSIPDHKYSRRQLIGMLACLIILPLICYFRSLSYDFLYELDDDWILVSNNSIKMISQYGFRKGLLYLFCYDTTDFHYHPITYLSMSLDYYFFGMHAWVYKLHNLILHLICGLLLFYFIQLLFKNRWIAFLVALFFLIHPMNIESVAWPSCRRQSLFFCYMLLSMISYRHALMSATRKRRWFLYALALICWVISMLAKASTLVMPGVFALIYIQYAKEQMRWKTLIAHLLPMLPIALLIIWLNEAANDRNYLVRDFSYSGFSHLIFAGYTYGFYWAKGIFPFPLVVFYPAPSEHFAYPPPVYFLLFAFSVLMLLLLLYHFLKKQYDLFFALGFYSVCIVPMLDLMYFPLKDLPMLVSNRYFYHTSPAIFLYLIFTVQHLTGKRWLRISLAAAYTVMLSVLFFVQIPVWKDEISMYEYNVRYYPCEEVMYKLALFYEYSGKGDKAVAMLDRADHLGTDIWVNNSWPYYQARGRLYLRAGKYDRALKDINTALGKTFGKTPQTDSILQEDKRRIENKLEN